MHKLKLSIFGIIALVLTSGIVGLVILLLLRILFCPRSFFALPTIRECIMVGLPVMWFLMAYTTPIDGGVKRNNQCEYGDKYYDYKLENDKIIMSWKMPEPYTIKWNVGFDGSEQPHLIKMGEDWYVSSMSDKYVHSNYIAANMNSLDFGYGVDNTPAIIRGGPSRSLSSIVIEYIIHTMAALSLIMSSAHSILRAKLENRKSKMELANA